MAAVANSQTSVIMDGDDRPLASDDGLVRRAQAGDRPALELLIRQHQRAVYGLCLRYVRDRDEAADLVQRTFVRAMEGLAGLRTAQSFRTWLLRIGANLALNHVRDQARFVHDDDCDALATRGAEVAPASSSADAGSSVEAGQTEGALREAIQTLPTKQRLTLELRIHEELSFRDIAEALGTTEGTAKVNFHHAVRNLKERLGAVTHDATPRKRRGS